MYGLTHALHREILSKYDPEHRSNCKRYFIFLWPPEYLSQERYNQPYLTQSCRHVLSKQDIACLCKVHTELEFSGNYLL